VTATSSSPIFGVALVIDSRLTQGEVRIGTPAFMAPEQLRGGAATRARTSTRWRQHCFELATGTPLVSNGERIDDPRRQLVDAGADASLADALVRGLSESADSGGRARVNLRRRSPSRAHRDDRGCAQRS
jgi:hypothetical protein